MTRVPLKGIYVLALLLAVVPVRAQVASTTSSETENKAMTVLKRMADFVSQAERFSVTLDIGCDVVQDWGQKIEFGETRQIVVRRPDRLRVDTTGRSGKRSGVIFSGQEIAVFNVEDKVYATVAQPGTLDKTTAYFLTTKDNAAPLATAPSGVNP